VLILTARGDPGDRIEGLSQGADDYLAKPFEPQELLLRVAAILRRSGRAADGPRRLSLGEYHFDLDRAELLHGEELVRLTEGEAQLMRALALKADQPVDRVELAGDDAEGTLRAVDVHITRLRRKIERNPKAPRYLQTVRGVGYMLAPD
jgi:two-component system phosphate regulon response regulator OmpR